MKQTTASESKKELTNLKEKIKELEKNLQEKEKLNSELINDLKRVQADFENYIKRTAKEKEKLELVTKQKIMIEILKLFDDFEIAFETLKNTSKDQESVNGIELLLKQFNKFLEDNGVKKIECVGKELDYNYHDAIRKEKSELNENIIIKEVQKGYIMNDDILRHAKVIISEGKNMQDNIDKEVKKITNEQK